MTPALQPPDFCIRGSPSSSPLFQYPSHANQLLVRLPAEPHFDVFRDFALFSHRELHIIKRTNNIVTQHLFLGLLLLILDRVVSCS